MSTPLIELKQYKEQDRRFFAKLEGANPTGSNKDRMAGYVIKRLEESGQLERGMTIVEASSGNTGIALAKAGSERGYKVLICMPKHISPKKKERIQELGGEIREYDTSDDPNKDINAARAFGESPRHYFFNQFENPHHVRAYEESLGKETVEQLTDLGLTIDVLVAGVGTGGSLIGLANRLRRDHNPNLKVIAVGPEKEPTIIEGLHPPEVRGNFKIWRERPDNFDQAYVLIPDRVALTHAVHLWGMDNLSVGPSSGAVLAAGLKHSTYKGNYLLLFHDNGEKYKGLFGEFYR